MEKVDYENLRKYKVKRIVKIVISLVLLFGAVGCFFWYKAELNKINNNIKSLGSILSEQNTNKKYKKIYLDANAIPVLILNGDDGEGYYIVKDEGRSYVVYMSDDDFYTLDRYDISEKAIRIVGVTNLLKNDVKEQIINTYNKNLDEKDKVALNDFDKYFGSVYLNMTMGDEVLVPIPFCLFIILLTIGMVEFLTNLIYLIIFIISVRKLENSLPNLEDEMNDSKMYYYKNVSLYLTDNYIINFNGRFKVIKYEDILWMYKFEQKKDNVIRSQNLKVLVKDGRTYRIAKAGRVSEEQKDAYDEIWEIITTKNPKILLGYTKENIKEISEVRKRVRKQRRSQTK